jgi:endonuclease-8
MPEGDTIHRTAAVLRRSLVGGTVTAARAQSRPGLVRVPRLDLLVGANVTAVEAHGKHLLIGFSDGRWLRTHMRMRGSWHRYAPGEPWRLPSTRASCILETDAAVAVCFDAPEVELLTDSEVCRRRALTSLGPDLMAPAFDAVEAVRRLRQRSGVPLGEALLDQRALAGIGNVYKSEICFIERADPWAPVSVLSEAALASLVATARRLLLANAAGGRRVTTGVARPGASLWVYRRAGRPCRRCGTRIEARRQGTQARVTYWCPRCQQGSVSGR